MRVRDPVATREADACVAGGASPVAGGRCSLGTAISGKRTPGKVNAGIGTGTAGASICARMTAVNITAYGSASAMTPASPNQYR